MAQCINFKHEQFQRLVLKSILFFFLLDVRVCQAVWPFSGGGGDHVGIAPPVRSPRALMTSQGSLPHFEVEGGSGMELAEQYARQNGLIEAGNDCRQRAYAELQRSCREIMQSADIRHRLAIQFANCFAAESGKPTFPCPEGRSIKDCTATMDDLAHSSYRSFFIHVDATCHHLQSEYFTQRTEGIVNRLVQSSHRTAEQLTSVSGHSEAILERADRSLSLQRTLESKQEGFRALLESSMDDVINATWRIRDGVGDVIEKQEAAAARQEEIASQNLAVMGRLEAQTERVSGGVNRSLEGQGELLKGQKEAVRKLVELRAEQERAFEVHTQRLVELSGIAERHAKEVATFQAGMEAAQERLASGSAAILEQQASFASKQADVFASLDRMFALYGAIVSESMALKSLLFYAAAVTIAYVLTATKRTRNARFWLYCGLTANFAVECALVRFFDPARQAAAVGSGIRLTRAAFALYSLTVLGLTLRTYRDFAVLSYTLLEAQSAKLAHIEKRLYQTPRTPKDDQLSLPANEETPRGTFLLPDMEGESFDVRAYWAESRKWDEEGSNAEPSSSDESYAPTRGLGGLGLRWREGYDLRRRPLPTWSKGREMLAGEGVDEFAATILSKTLYNQYAEHLAETSSEESSKVTVSVSLCDSHLTQEVADEASSYDLTVTSSWMRARHVAVVPRSTAGLRRSRRQSAAC
ncbi:hypothetical protein KFL_001430050 [Klebsormidium nitens]|uniref:Protein GAMETE EXPRESSED 1 n=1 Tax=Klebsormidium nitens TaxID=105231 RepID=A0A1Y1HZZ7_KLENI|nr:hypothetical protein KFL_001430050 [Klebsormidium nitens]|eukprot:GAQ83302.1 hypothetical protein KFL_001430050 [Klebsormidium nitens]